MYQAQADMLQPMRALARAGTAFARMTDLGSQTPAFMRQFAAGCGILEDAGMTHARPDYGIDTVRVGDADVAVTEEIALDTPFASLLHFRKDIPEQQPRVLLVAPMSGHFATLLRGTVRTLLRDHDVYITDWKNARDVPLADGTFDLDSFVEHLILFMETVGPGGHLVAVCQPTVAALAAVAVMAEDRNPAQPRSMTLMAGPIDTRINPTKVNELAKSKPIEWFAENLIGTVPWRYKGGGRRVYPGFLQLSGFMAMNLDRHINAHVELFKKAANGDHKGANVTREFYDEYFAVMDMPAEFYLQTIKNVFQDHLLPRDLLSSRGRKIEPKAIRKIGLMTVEGERDDICSVGQTYSAQELCSALSPSRRSHHLQPSVGHYGLFAGRRWENEIYPRVKEFIRLHR